MRPRKSLKITYDDVTANNPLNNNDEGETLFHSYNNNPPKNPLHIEEISLASTILTL